jgi:hypothetical protein
MVCVNFTFSLHAKSQGEPHNKSLNLNTIYLSRKSPQMNQHTYTDDPVIPAGVTAPHNFTPSQCHVV